MRFGQFNPGAPPGRPHIAIMDTWIALLRGINVGGANRLPMAELRDVLNGREMAAALQSGA